MDSLVSVIVTYDMGTMIHLSVWDEYLKMGLTFTKLFSRLFTEKETCIFVVGLDAAGKTMIMYKLKLGEIVTTIPTIGFNVETVENKNINFNVCPLWRYYFQNTQAYFLWLITMTRIVLLKIEMRFMGC